MNEVAIEELLANDRFVRRLASSLLGDSATAEDVAQETYLRAMVNGPREGGSVRGWLSRVVRNIAANVRRGGRNRADRERLASRHEAGDPASLIVEREELRRRLLAAILKLGAPRSTIVLMRYFEGAPPRAIAKRLGMPVETVRTHLKRSIATLRERLGSETRRDGTSVLMALPMLVAGSPDLGASIGMVLMSLKTKIALASACVLAGVSVWVATKIDFTGASGRPIPAASTAELTSDPADSPREAKTSIVGSTFHEPTQPESLPHDAVAGIVVDDAGAPVGGARVSVCDAGAMTAVPIDAASRTDARTPSSTSDASGRFMVSLAPPDRILALCAFAPGFAPAVLAPVAMGSRQTLVLGRAVRIGGRTIDTAGNPVKNVRVRWSGEGRGIALVRETTSGDTGEFEIGDLPSGALARGMSAYLSAEAEGFSPLAIPLRESGLDFTRPGSRVEHDLVLARGVVVRGRVYDAETKVPIAGVSVGFHSWVSVEGSTSGSRAKADRHAQTDERGAYSFDRIPSLGFHVLGSRIAGNPVGFIRVSTPGFAVSFSEVPSSPEGVTLDIDVPCWHTATVRGRVVDSGGKPAAGTTVWAYTRSLGNVQARSVTAGPDGRFVLDGIAAKTAGSTPAEVTASPEDANLLSGAGEFARHELDLRAGDDLAIPDLVLNPLAAVRIHVVEESGLPVCRARARSGIRGFGSETAADGKCRIVFELRSEGQRCNVRIWAAGFASALLDDVVPSRKPAEITVVLKPGRSLRGRVLWSDRSPAADVGLTLAQGPGASAVLEKGPEVGVYGDDYYKTFFASSRSDAEGRFEFMDLPEGPYEIGARVSPDGQTHRPGEEVRAKVSDVRDDGVEIILPTDGAALRAGSPLEGTVTFAGARPVPSFTAELSNGTTTKRGLLPSLGRFRFERVTSGRWTLRIEGSGFLRVDREIMVDGNGPPPRVDIVVEEGLSIVGTVRVPHDVRLADVMVFFRKRDDDVGTKAVIAADGSYRASGLMPGRYTMDVTYPNAGHWGKALTATGTLTVEVKSASSPTRRDIEVIRGGWLSVGISKDVLKGRGPTRLRIVDSAGAIAYELAIQPLEDDVGGTGASIALPEGAYTICFEDGAKIVAQKEVMVSAAAASSVHFE